MRAGLPVSTQGGFSLLEAIVAMTLVATMGMAIFAWINGLLISVEKIENNFQQDSLRRNVVSYFADINIMENSQGYKQLGPYQLDWRSELIEPPRKGKTIAGGPSEYTLGLYNVFVTVKQKDRNITQLNFRQVGFSAKAVEIF